MRKQAEINKVAWEYRAYDFWNRTPPDEKAMEIKQDPLARFHLHREFFDQGRVFGKKIANPCGSNGRMAVSLALLGADVTVFDISEENARYARELATEAGVKIEYVLGDFCETDIAKYNKSFDIVYAEGGITHYFSDMDALAKVLFSITKKNGLLILSDFHPYRKVNRTGSEMMSVKCTDGDYFDSRLHNVNVAYQHLFPQDEQREFPQCQCRHYTMGEIVNAVITAGFTMRKLLEHPSYEDAKLPGLYTILACRE